MYLVASILVAIGLHYTAPILSIIPAPWDMAGIVLIILGVAIVIQPALSFKSAQTEIKPFQESSSLVRTGMYRISRNPMYLGMLTVLTGTAVYLGSLSPFVTLILFYLIIRHRFVRVEEAMLEEKFGAEYREFKQAVRRWI